MSKYTNAEIEFLQKNKPYFTSQELYVLFQDKFDSGHTLESVKSKLKHIGIRKVNEYGEEQYDFLRKYGGKLTTKELTKKLNARFNSSHSEQSVRTITKRLGVTKDKETIANERIERSKVAIGDSAWANGYEYIKVREGTGNFYKNYERKCRIVWEEKYGKLPKGWQVVFLNGDKTDCRIENLMAVSNQITARMANGRGRSMWSENAEITKSAIAVCKLEQTIKDNK